MSANTMEYRGYAARLEYSDEDGCLIGRVVGINDRLVFDGESVPEVRERFHAVLDNYLEACKRQGKKSERPRSGKVLVRLPPELHASVSRQSEETGRSLNQLVVDALRECYDPQPSPRRSRRKPPPAMESKSFHSSPGLLRKKPGRRLATRSRAGAMNGRSG